MAVLFAGLIVSATFSCKADKEEQGIKAGYRPLTEAVYSTVTVEPADLYTVYAAAGGILQHRYVREGDTVKTGQQLFLIDREKASLNTASARLNFEQAMKDLEGPSNILGELETGLAAAQLRLKNDSLKWVQQTALWKQQIGSEQNYTDRVLAYELSKKEVNRLKEQFRRTKSDLEIRKKLAQTQLKASLAGETDFEVTSRLNGLVYQTMVEAGEAVAPQTPLAQIGSGSEFVIKMLIDEVDISRLQVGQKVLISLDAFEAAVFEAAVSRILPSMDVRSQTFSVEARFIEAPEKLYNGLTGEANIIIREKPRVLCIPNTYLAEGNKVWTENGPIEVKTGLKNLEFTEILEGIDTSLLLIKPE